MKYTQTTPSRDAHVAAIIVAFMIAMIASAFWSSLLTRYYILKYLASVTPMESVLVPQLAAVPDVGPPPQTMGEVFAEKNVVQPLLGALLKNNDKTIHRSAPTAVVKSEQRALMEEWRLQKRYAISIPAIGVNAPVYVPARQYWNVQNWKMLEKQMQAGLTLGAVAYPHSVGAGDVGNLIIAGHSSPPNEQAKNSDYGHLFARIPELKVGDTITILENGSYVDYEVFQTELVSENETTILVEQDEDSLLKLITCYPVGTTRDRWVVTAKKVGEG